jgi:tetratricopeptide (TPR) repeat protein
VDERARSLAAAAAECLDLAGRRALDRGDMTAAVNLLERERGLRPAQELNLALEVSLIWGLAACGRLNDAIARTDDVAANCSAVGDRVGELRARLTGAMWRTNVDPTGYEAALRDLVEQARPFLERSGDDAALASLEFAASFVNYYSCRFGAALAACTRSIELARQADERWLVRECRDMAAGSVAFGPTPIDEALQWLESARAESGAFQPGFDVSRATLLAYLGRLDEARSLFAETVNQMTERGFTTWVAMSCQVPWQIEMLSGDPVAAERAARQGCELLEQLGERAWMSTVACQLAESLYSLGRYEEAEEWTLRGVELGGSHDVLTQLMGLQMRSKLLARRGDQSAALSAAEEADKLAATTDAWVVHGDAALNMAEVQYLVGNPSRVAQEVQRAINHYERRGATGCVTRARSLAATWTI